ncbi:hypothetical protein EJ03DRAFT_111403 [Teratosphaeria nubilosa]|uniref:Uncharacterized protein n=1 Tax=Teratosphaeria nubilosa TaxID=161662 RepID=A0A6G1L7W0_9PEZI|nr:hypothetical protein EJ03DRAFT_111403 [Teratosphaeria nubilosa]
MLNSREAEHQLLRKIESALATRSQAADKASRCAAVPHTGLFRDSGIVGQGGDPEWRQSRISEIVNLDGSSNRVLAL